MRRCRNVKANNPDPNQASLRSPYHLLPAVTGATKTLTRLPAPSHYSARLEVTATRSDIERIELSGVVWLGADASDRYPPLHFRNGGVMVPAPGGGFVARCDSSTCPADDWVVEPVDFDHVANDEFAVWTIRINPSNVRKARLEVHDLQGGVTGVLLGLAQLMATAHPNGRFTSNPGGLSCGSDCTELLPLGSAVQVTMSPNPGFELLSWTGCPASSGNTCSATLHDDLTVSVTLRLIRPSWVLLEFMRCNGTSPEFLATWQRISGVNVDADVKYSGNAYRPLHNGTRSVISFSGINGKATTVRVRNCPSASCSSFKSSRTLNLPKCESGGGGGSPHPL